MDTQLQLGRNTGVIEAMPGKDDFLAAGETGVSLPDQLESGDWRRYAPAGERQKNMSPVFETNGCVSFSALDTLETGGNFCMELQLWTEFEEHIQWARDNGYFGADGKWNFSDRFTVTMSGTDPDRGNKLQAVWDSCRNHGLVPESKWPFPAVTGDKAKDQAEYFKRPPQELIDLGLEFKKRFEIKYEWVAYPGAWLGFGGLKAQLKKSPLQIVTAVCPPWNTAEVIKACGPGGAHATMLGHIDAEPASLQHILDHYVPFWKRFASDYTITFAMRGVMVPRALLEQEPVLVHQFKVNLYAGAPSGEEVKMLQTALQSLADKAGQPYMKKGVFGPFGPQTQAALARFQADEGIPDGPPGANFGPKTRAAMNRRVGVLRYKAPQGDESGNKTLSMQLLQNAWKWFSVSSANAENWSASIKASGLLLIPIVLQVSGIACGLQLFCTGLIESDLQQLVATVANVAYNAGEIITGLALVWAMFRKVKLTMAGQHAAFK